MRGFQYPLQNNIKLPPGSKDLVALTLPTEKGRDFARGWDSVSGWMPAEAQPEGIDHGASWRIEKHVSYLLCARLKPSFLAIQVGAYPLQLFCETDAGPLRLLLGFPENDMDREQAACGFFTDRGIESLADHLLERPGWHVIQYALPCIVGQASRLMTTLVRTAYGVSEYFPAPFSVWASSGWVVVNGLRPRVVYVPPRRFQFRAAAEGQGRNDLHK